MHVRGQFVCVFALLGSRPRRVSKFSCNLEGLLLALQRGVSTRFLFFSVFVPLVIVFTLFGSRPRRVSKLRRKLEGLCHRPQRGVSTRVLLVPVFAPLGDRVYLIGVTTTASLKLEV